jgi:hypothetical protein
MNPVTRSVVLGFLFFVVNTGALAQQTRTQATTTQLLIPSPATQGNAGVDFGNAQALPMPTPVLSPPTSDDAVLQARNARIGARRTPGHAPGGVGNGRRTPVRLVSPAIANQQAQVAPQEFALSSQPFTTNRVNAEGDDTQSYFAFRPTGKLFFNKTGLTYVCSASLIKPGLVVTAAHCVADFGHRQFYSNWVFVPAYDNGTAPFGSWTAVSATVLTSYLDGTDACAVSGIVCEDDVAVLTLQSQNGEYAGSRTGWYGYAWDGYGFNASGQALITQLGYPVALDGGGLMQRNDSQGYTASGFSNNTIIGSLMTGGSSGGPWHVNLGIQPALSGIASGQSATRNTVIGVTSWGYTDTSLKQQGASAFTSNNIAVLVNIACTATPEAC